MAGQKYLVVFLLYLVGHSVCLLPPHGEIKLGRVFPGGDRLFGHKYFEGFIDKGAIKPLLAKKVLLGVGAVAAAGGAALIAKKIHESKGFGGWNGNKGWYPSSSQSHGGWYPSSTDYDYNSYSQGGLSSNVNFPQSDYQYPSQSYSSGSSSGGYYYPSSSSSSSGYGGYEYGGQSGGGNVYQGWSR